MHHLPALAKRELRRLAASMQRASLPPAAPRDALFPLAPSLQSPPTPLPIVLGMLFTNGACPLLLALAPAFYRCHRTAVLLLVSRCC